MKNGAQYFVWLLIASLSLGACQSARKHVESGNYDDAIDFCVRKLRGKKKKKDEYVQGLELAFQKAQSRDLARVNNLIAQNRPENWERIHEIHLDIARRQNLVLPLTPLTSSDGYKAKFDFVDIASMQRESREKAAEHLYQYALEHIDLGERGDKRAARSAYNALEDLELRYFREYKDKNALKRRARDLGTSYVLFEVQNRSNTILPRAFADRLLKIGKSELDSEWKVFDFEARSGTKYDYKAVFKVQDIDISPERVFEREYVDEKEIEDGWDYVLDARGNVKKDSSGNDIKIKRYARIRAFVLEVRQTKAARLAGLVEIRNMQNDDLIETKSLGTEILFEHFSATFRGDARALSEDSRCRIGSTPAPFPRDEDMLVQAADRLKPDLRRRLKDSGAIF